MSGTRRREGRTTTAFQLARAWTAAGQRVVVVDMDLRNPDIHRLAGGHRVPGVRDVLSGHSPLQDAMQFVGPAGGAGSLYLLAAGSDAEAPADLLSSDRSRRLIESLSESADAVIIDCPAVTTAPEALIVGRMATGVVLVAEAGRTDMGALQRAKELLARNQVKVLGVVLNRYAGNRGGWAAPSARLPPGEPGY